MAARTAVAWRALGDSRVRIVSFALLFLLFAYANAAGYRHTYPTLKDRLSFARSFGSDKAVQLFYGVPHDLLSVGGYTAWRVGGTGSVFAALWGLLAATRALRAEEDAGRQELVLAGSISRRSAYLAALAGIGAGAVVLWVALTLGLVVARLPAGASCYLALAVLSPLLVFAGVGAVAAQIAGTRRGTLELAGATLALAVLLRIVADTSNGLGGLRWATPLGWVEELRSFADPSPFVFVLPALTGATLLAAAGAIAARRDVGTGLIRGRDSSEPELRLLSSPTALALRSERVSLAAWLTGVGIFALIVGLISTSFSNANIPADVRRQLHKLGGASITTPAGAVGFYFLLFVLAISLFVCGQVANARREESDQQLETLLALPMSRIRWLTGRVLLAAATAAALALAAGALAWVGAASQGAGISLARLLEAGANCLPTAFLFLGLGTVGYAIVPRGTSGIAYGLVSLAFVWYLVGGLLGAPHWLVELTPFAHVGLVPAQPLHRAAAATMLAIALAATASAALLFRRRDLAGA